MIKTIIFSTDAPAPIGPYSQAVQVDSTIYVSGQIALDQATGKLMTDEGIVIETHQVMRNIRFILREAGVDFENVVKCTIFVKDLGNFATINEVYGSYFDELPPARETVEVSRLPKDVNVEISCVAIL